MREWSAALLKEGLTCGARGQKTRVLSLPTDPVDQIEEEGRRGLAECLKYPFKPATATTAQVVEAYLTFRGRKLSQVFGCLSGNSRVMKMAKGEAEGGGLLVELLREGLAERDSREPMGVVLEAVGDGEGEMVPGAVLTVRRLERMERGAVDLFLALPEGELIGWRCTRAELLKRCRAPPWRVREAEGDNETGA